MLIHYFKPVYKGTLKDPWLWLSTMRATLFIAAILAVTPASSKACTCAGTQSISGALVTAEAVVVGRVKEHTAGDYSSEHRRPAAIVVEVTNSLRGGLNGNIEIAETLMCYQSFTSEDFKLGTSYVFPLKEIDLANPDDTFRLMIEPISPNLPNRKMFTLPICSHSALLIDGAKLYSNELNASGGRRLEYYMSLATLQFLFATGLFNVWSYIAIIVTVIVLGVGLLLTRRRRANAHGE